MKPGIQNQRAETISEAARQPLDLLVIGGGIVGAGVARDAAMRGLRVAVAERHDFAFGTSSRSSRLLHGGLRYLAQGRIGLVREASLEKKVIHRIAPHLALPLGFVFPTYRGSGWPLWQMRIGVKFYDLLCSGRNLGRSSAMPRRVALEVLPQLQPEKLTGAVRYFDALTNDARLVLDTLRSAAEHRALCLNYFEFKSARRTADAWVCQCADRATGRSHELHARAVLNATGPWAGNIQHSQVKLRLTKGIHLVVDRSRLPTTDAVVITEGKRILFIIPWGERLIIGTTDTDYEGAPEDVQTDAEDVDYVLRTVNEFFPTVRLVKADVISTWAGLRPLIAKADGTPSDISRAHEIRSPEPGWWDVAGGKLTTYRLMAEQSVDRIVAWLGRQKGGGSAFKECRTANEPLVTTDGADSFSGILPPPFTRAMVEHACAREWAVHLDDVMVRRTSWHYYHRNARQMAGQTARWMSEILGWSPEETREELSRYEAGLAWPPPARTAFSSPARHGGAPQAVLAV
jgi:glycerol-3-phosphate dehydrogenase